MCRDSLGFAIDSCAEASTCARSQVTPETLALFGKGRAALARGGRLNGPSAQRRRLPNLQHFHRRLEEAGGLR